MTTLSADATNAYANSPPPETPTFVRVDDAIVFLSEDGVYSLQGASPTKISKPIEAALRAYPLTPAGELAYSTAIASYAQREYTLFIGSDIFVFSLDSAQWRQNAFGLSP